MNVALVETFVFFALQAGLLFLATNAAFAVVGFRILDPDLVRERALPGPGIQRWDVVVSSIGFVLLHPLALLVAGFDVGRYGWSPPLPLVLRLGALGVYVVGNGVALWAAHENRFFSSFVRIQTERGHRVVTSGPYAFVRHPGYGGGILGYVAVPLALGSLWGLVPACLGVAFFVARTIREDRLLHEQLDGYREYAARVRWRWLPGIW